MGFAGVVRYRGLRIGGISGIFDKHHYNQGNGNVLQHCDCVLHINPTFCMVHYAVAHFEAPPYTPNTLRSVYHTRSIDIHRLLCLQDDIRDSSSPLDIFVSHDWPLNVCHHGDLGRLLAIKPYFREDIEKGELGSPALATVLQTLQPSLWFAAHLHVKFEAVVAHHDKATHFLALDKVIMGR